MTDSKSRFEAHFGSAWNYGVDELGIYLNRNTYHKYDGWQACEAQSAARIAKLEAGLERIAKGKPDGMLANGERLYTPYPEASLIAKQTLTNHLGY